MHTVSLQFQDTGWLLLCRLKIFVFGIAHIVPFKITCALKNMQCFRNKISSVLQCDFLKHLQLSTTAPFTYAKHLDDVLLNILIGIFHYQ